MKFSSKFIKKLAVIGILVFSVGTLAACSNNLPSAEEIVKNNKKFKDYNSLDFKFEAGYKGKDTEELSAQYVKNSQQLAVATTSDKGKMKVWIPDDKSIYMQASGITIKEDLSKYKDFKSQIDSMNSVLGKISDLMNDVSIKNKDWKVSETDSSYVLEASSDKVKINDLKTLFEGIGDMASNTPSFDENSKLKNVKMKFVVGKKKFDTQQAKMSYDIVSDKTYHVALDYKFNNVKNIKVPSDIKDDAIDTSKFK